MAATGREPSPAVDESGHSRSQRFNVGNLRDTGHSAEPTPPAAKADDLPTLPGLRPAASRGTPAAQKRIPPHYANG